MLFPPWSSPEAIAFINGLTMKQQAERLGAGDDVDAIKGHPFFATIDWVKLANREVEPPFKPAGKGQGDIANFDQEFTSEDASLTPTEQVCVVCGYPRVHIDCF